MNYRDYEQALLEARMNRRHDGSDWVVIPVWRDGEAYWRPEPTVAQSAEVRAVALYWEELNTTGPHSPVNRTHHIYRAGKAEHGGHWDTILDTFVEAEKETGDYAAREAVRKLIEELGD